MPIKITTRKDGFWRAGVQHFGTQVHPDGKFTPEQLAILSAEPRLIVEEIAAVPDDPEGGEEPQKAKPTQDKQKGK